MERESKENPKFIPSHYWVVGAIIAIFVISLWSFCMYKTFGNFQQALTTLPTMIGSIGAVYVAIMGGIGAGNGAFSSLRNLRKGGTPYYSTRYGPWRLRKVINKFDDVSEEAMLNKVLLITKLQDRDVNGNKVVSNKHNSIYSNCVYCLQQSDFDFLRVWNDFNYYGAIVSKSRRVRRYCFRLEKYIHCRILQIKDDVIKELKNEQLNTLN